VVQRQRLGNSIARLPPEAKARQIINASPAAELRFHASRFTFPSTTATPIHHSSSAIRPSPSIPLNVHSYYSFLDSTLSISAIIDLAKRHELPAIALTDKHNLHGAVEFAETAARAGIKAIIGTELQWNSQRLCLYVENQTGYHNLCRILSRVESPKPETRKKSEVRSPKSEVRPAQSVLLRISDLGLPSAFGLRTSGFPLRGCSPSVPPPSWHSSSPDAFTWK